MVAYISAGNGKGRTRQVRGVRLWEMPMPMEGALAELRRRRRWRALRNLGVRQAILPPALVQEARKWGIGMPEVYPLRRAVWEQLLPPWGNTALLRAAYVDAAVQESAMTLARRFRYLRIETGWGTARLARELLRQYGLSVGGVVVPDTAVSFGGKPTEAGEICLGTDCRRWQYMEYENVDGLEDLTPSEELLCVIFQGGGVKKEEIRIKRSGNNA